MRDLGLSRSEFFARAAERYIDALDAQSATKQIDTAIERIGEVDETNETAAEAGRRMLREASDEW